MTSRERLLAILDGRQPDVVPWFGDLDYWATALIGRGEKPEDFKLSDAYLDWHRSLGVGFYLQGYFPFRTVVDNCEVREWRERNLRRREVVTPAGTLRETWTWMENSFSEAPTERLVKSAADLPAYRFLHENTHYEPDYAVALQRREQVGEIGVVLCYLPKSPLMQLIALDAGVTATVEMSADAPEELAETIGVLRRSHDRAARIAIASPAEILMIPENLSSECVGRKLYELFVRDYQTLWAEAIRDAGKYSCIHLDGTMKGLLREVCSTPLDFIEALTPAPVGDLAIERWAETSGNSSTILWGGLPGIYFTPMVSDAEFEAHVRRVLAVMRSAPRYVLGVADQVPPDALESRVRQVAGLVERYGVYE